MSTTPSDDVKHLRDALEAGPTLGEWSVNSRFGEWSISSDHSVGGSCQSGRQFVAACFRVSKKDTPKYAAMFETTARYIAAANPARIARLLDHIEALERDAARWRMLPAFIEDHQIDYMLLLREIDTAIASEAKP